MERRSIDVPSLFFVRCAKCHGEWNRRYEVSRAIEEWNARTPLPTSDAVTPSDSQGHAGDCTVYSDPINGQPFDGICTCGYGFKSLREGDPTRMCSEARLIASNEGQPPLAEKAGNSPSVSALLLALEEARKALEPFTELKCICHEAYKARKLSDPQCYPCDLVYEIRDAISALSSINKVLKNKNLGE